MGNYLIGVNLPCRFKLWYSDNYIHQPEINSEASDSERWEYAKRNDLTIITKDSNFSNRILLNDPPPKVIHIRFGNLRINEFHNYLNRIWADVLKLNVDYKLINIFLDRIEGIN
jgi:predicted nuclease of predicted toxin-antitoxin system